MNRQSKRSASGNCKRHNLSRLFSCLIVWTVVILSIIGNWFVRHDEAWFLDKCEKLPSPLVYVLKYLGEPFADITDSFDITGEDVTYQTYSEIPSNNVFFAGAPVMPTSARSDVAILDKNEFVVAYSHSLKHPVWCAYRIPRDKRHSESKRPSFKRDKNIESCPAASSYARTGYDRGHMVPNYAISTRYGETAQAKTFLMSNISPQTPELNRGIWREIEHRAADLFTARWGDVWVIVGTISNGCENLSGTDIDVPTMYYQILTAVENGKIRMLPLVIEQSVPWKAWPRHYLTSVDNIEKLTGLDFFAKLDDVVESSLESRVPSRMWPVKFLDSFRALRIHLNERL